MASCLALRLGLVSGGGEQTPLWPGPALEGGGPEVRPTRPPGILGGWEPRQGEGVSANKYLPGAGLMFPGCGGTLGGTARRARWSGTSTDPACCFRGQLRGEQGAGPRGSLGLQSPCPHPRHKITGLQAAGLEPRATGPLSHTEVVAAPWRSDRRPTPYGPLAPPKPRAHTLDPAGLCQPHCHPNSPPK